MKRRATGDPSDDLPLVVVMRGSVRVYATVSIKPRPGSGPALETSRKVFENIPLCDLEQGQLWGHQQAMFGQDAMRVVNSEVALSEYKLVAKSDGQVRGQGGPCISPLRSS